MSAEPTPIARPDRQELIRRVGSSGELINWLDDQIGEFGVPGGLRPAVALACNDLVRQHHRAIVKLLGEGLYASGSALLRVMFETYVRGVWLYRCADDNQLRRFKKDRLILPIAKAIEQVEQLDDFSGGVLSGVKQAQWNQFCSFTHGGVEAIGRQLNSGTVEPNFHVGEVLDILDHIDAVAMLAAMQFALLKGDQELQRRLLDRAELNNLS